MTTPLPLAALASRLRGFFVRPRPQPIPAPLPPLTWYILTHEFGGPEHVFACTPENVRLCLALLTDHGLSDVCRDALAEAIARRPEEPARYGDWWTLTSLKGEA
ncbi:hypothetical protein DEIPH_ctg011orf0049 [Deinococcus phoenicis]|uniref:Uncharacterized protein n=1 Tax=Deinococcus phoenicis TaxID=1476583 RepID=A0A016QSX9_9DEIO|nr:hypothetical protein [Deinococcus phoenicis]EYB69081.1 hypothetical protein DEIPH_ctg011orf0049 [Deinococcus phoenicis]